MRSAPSTIFSLQILRFIAAFMVVCSHLDDRLAGFAERYGVDVFPLHLTGAFGVRIFFVISGFIMVWICLNGRGGTPSGRDFFLGRCARIIPIYWLLTAFQMAFLLWAVSRGDPSATSKAAGWAEFAKSLLFIPYLNGEGGHRPVIEQGWTLNYEMFFYAAFALCLVFAKRAAPVLCAVLLGAFFALGLRATVPGPFGLLANDYLLSFIVGMGLGLWRLRAQPVVPKAIVLPAAIALILVGNYAALGSATPAVWHSTFAAAIVALCVFGQEDAPGRVRRFFVDLGGASYSLYLVHGFVLLAVGVVWRKVFGGHLLPAYYALAVVLSVAASVALQRWVERPSERWAKRHLLRREAPVGTPALT